MKKKLSLGKIDYNGTGRKVNAVELEINLKETEKGYVFSMSGGIWNHIHTDYICCGQMCDEIGKMFHHNKMVQRLVNIWEQYHLNDLNAGTINQEKALESFESKDYTKQCEYLKSIGLYEDNGYKYGTAWLFRQIPDEVIDEIKTIINNPII